MRRCLLLVSISAATWMLASPASAQNYTPTSAYQKQQSWGFTVLVAPAVSKQGKQSSAALNLLRAKLAEATKTLPKQALLELRKVPIFVEHESSSESCIGYHPAAEPLDETAVNLEKRQAIEIGALSCFFDKANGDEPMVLVRELALAYLDRVIGWDAPEIKAVWEQAKKGDQYRLVPYVTGGMLPPPGIASPQFFFAETTESLFGQNDYFPFHREDLARYDPDACAAVAKAWGAPGLCEATQKPPVEQKQKIQKRGRYRRPR